MNRENIIRFHHHDLPDLQAYQTGFIAIDTETTGLKLSRDRLCLVQISPRPREVDLIRISPDQPPPVNLLKLLQDPQIEKIFHFGRFDIAMLMKRFNCQINSVFCTKIASRLTRTYTDRHSLKHLCQELLHISLTKAAQSSDWAAAELSEGQKRYAASDVLYLHELRNILTALLEREQRLDLAKACFAFLPMRAALDLAGWEEQDIFSHHIA